jgi:ribosomal protein L17
LNGDRSKAKVLPTEQTARSTSDRQIVGMPADDQHRRAMATDLVADVVDRNVDEISVPDVRAKELRRR